MRTTLLFAVVTLLVCSVAGAQQWFELQPVPGVTVGALKYHQSATKRDPALEAAIAKAFKIPPGQEVLYLYNQTSLTKGGQHALVLLPEPQFSGSGGSSAAVFERQGPSYRLVTQFTLLRPPVVVASSSTAGWRDLVVRTSGGGLPARFSRLRFNGRTYPRNPTNGESLPTGTVVAGTAFLAISQSSRFAGLLFKAP